MAHPQGVDAVWNDCAGRSGMEKYRDNDPGKEQTAYDRLSDEALLRQLRAGDAAIMDYVLDKYKPLVRKKANAMFLIGGDTDDLIQEGMIGLFKAVRDYDTEQEVSFGSFARLCIRRQMYSAAKASGRKKHIPLNSYVSFYEEAEQGGREYVLDTIEAGVESNPEHAMIMQESMNRIGEELEESLSDLESRVLYLHLLGTDYKTIAGLLKKSPKTIDNALQRIKNKAGKILNK